MDLISIFAIAVALAMDAFAVALATSLALNPVTGGQVFRFSFHFGLFQAMMPVIGWLAGTVVYKYIAVFDHWIAFGLLAFVGGKMIYGALSPEESERAASDPTRGWDLIILSVATSIDALAVGLSLAMLQISVWFPAMIIGLVAAGFTTLGLQLAKTAARAARIGQWAETLGGLVLFGIGFRILFDHGVFG